MTVHIVTKHK